VRRSACWHGGSAGTTFSPPPARGLPWRQTCVDPPHRSATRSSTPCSRIRSSGGVISSSVRTPGAPGACRQNQAAGCRHKPADQRCGKSSSCQPHHPLLLTANDWHIGLARWATSRDRTKCIRHSEREGSIEIPPQLPALPGGIPVCVMQDRVELASRLLAAFS
jgi:hypothetical protein